MIDIERWKVYAVGFDVLILDSLDVNVRILDTGQERISVEYFFKPVGSYVKLCSKEPDGVFAHMMELLGFMSILPGKFRPSEVRGVIEQLYDFRKQVFRTFETFTFRLQAKEKDYILLSYSKKLDYFYIYYPVGKGIKGVSKFVFEKFFEEYKKIFNFLETFVEQIPAIL